MEQHSKENEGYYWLDFSTAAEQRNIRVDVVVDHTSTTPLFTVHVYIHVVLYSIGE